MTLAQATRFALIGTGISMAYSVLENLRVFLTVLFSRHGSFTATPPFYFSVALASYAASLAFIWFLFALYRYASGAGSRSAIAQSALAAAAGNVLMAAWEGYFYHQSMFFASEFGRYLWIGREVLFRLIWVAVLVPFARRAAPLPTPFVTRIAIVLAALTGLDGAWRSFHLIRKALFPQTGAAWVDMFRLMPWQDHLIRIFWFMLVPPLVSLLGWISLCVFLVGIWQWRSVGVGHDSADVNSGDL